MAGDEIPIAAQVVALADVYDALSSKRVYKDAFSHVKTLEMILGGECGAFNPLLLECLNDISDVLQGELKVNSLVDFNRNEVRNITDEMIKHEELSASERTLRLLEHERTKYRFFASMSNEVQFEYTVSPAMVTVSEGGAKQLGISEFIMNPFEDKEINSVFRADDLKHMETALKSTTPREPVIQRVCKIFVKGEARWCRIIARSMWSADDIPQFIGAIGKLVDITDEQRRLTNLEKMAHHDTLTGLLNSVAAKAQILERLKKNPGSKFALIIVDVDYFKQVNDGYGHLFGDEILKIIADKISQNVTPDDVAARIGGDEFLLFVKFEKDIEGRIEGIFEILAANKQAFRVSVSMGVAVLDGKNVRYETLFHRADQALYASKRAGRGTYRIYDESMCNMFSALSPIDGEVEKGLQP